jgi:vacuolar-type H+-ATPase subunit I/STV1
MPYIAEKNDQLARIDVDEAQQLYKEDKRLYEPVKVGREDRETQVVVHLRTQANIRDALVDFEREWAELEPSRNFVSVLIEFLEQKELTSSKEQNKFRKELLEAHSSWDDERMNVYCPTSLT